MYRLVPNLLTVLRLLLAACFFVVLNTYRYPLVQHGALWGAITLFILAAVTDAFDGHLARKWQAESVFGRIMDPICDKLLVIGAFIYLSGPRFVIPSRAVAGEFFTMVTGVYPWMVAVMLLRELLVTDLRSTLEATGTQFPAKGFGKLKMVLQSIAVPVVLFIVWLDPEKDGWKWLVYPRDIMIYATVIVTVFSGWPYVRHAAGLLRPKEK